MKFQFWTSLVDEGVRAAFTGGTRQGKHFFDRPQLTQRLKSALRSGNHVLLYGPPRQGKTAIYNNCLGDAKVCFVDGADEPKRKEIYRMLLSFLGCSIAVEEKRKKKYGLNVGVKLFSASVGGDGGGEVETVVKQVEIDIGNPSELAHLIAGIGMAPIVLINNFQCLEKGVQRSILQDMCFFHESSNIRFVLVGSWDDELYLERVCPQVSVCVDKVLFDYWPEAELVGLGQHCNAQLAAPLDTKIYQLIAAESGGNVDAFCRLCILYLGLRSRGEVPQNPDANWLSSVSSDYRFNWFRALYVPRLGELAVHGDMVIDYKVEVEKVVDDTDQDDDTDKKNDGDGKTMVVEELRSHFVGAWLLNYCAATDAKAKSFQLSIDDLCETFSKEVLAQATHVNRRRLRRVFQGVEEVQRDLNIVPRLFTLGSGGLSLLISAPDLQLYLSKVNKDEFADMLEDCIEDTPSVGARRRNRVWRED